MPLTAFAFFFLHNPKSPACFGKKCLLHLPHPCIPTKTMGIHSVHFQLSHPMKSSFSFRQTSFAANLSLSAKSVLYFCATLWGAVIPYQKDHARTCKAVEWDAGDLASRTVSTSVPSSCIALARPSSPATSSPWTPPSDRAMGCHVFNPLPWAETLWPAPKKFLPPAKRVAAPTTAE